MYHQSSKGHQQCSSFQKDRNKMLLSREKQSFKDSTSIINQHQHSNIDSWLYTGLQSIKENMSLNRSRNGITGTLNWMCEFLVEVWEEYLSWELMRLFQFWKIQRMLISCFLIDWRLQLHKRASRQRSHSAINGHSILVFDFRATIYLHKVDRQP